MANLISFRDKTSDLLTSLRREVDRTMQDWFGHTDFEPNSIRFMPHMDVTEDDKHILVKAELPGISQKDIDLSINHNFLTIKGSKKEEHEEKEASYHIKECRYGNFMRSIALPMEVDMDHISADFQDGILQVVIPKTASKESSKKIEIQNKESKKH
ncbi:Hsp20/alpha crystallin family protein [Rickettsiales endosymbiont of Stachyamoeba lipophora]|uniref:Hsp20/alpha crystallin family protein n=1 Tax=Rickettsiales endosymbiont of Stachyamoeba lipophora TaxID=2486578 RepID=UPI000F64AC85|nr:Hsp20/alpha crystallin family protein [Rickettsiales endosymbiont of Stachyamoeba lipophora]AZL15494.1 Hsp20/alpha crystallin family protein [Rickettsiales endosymbiont of Stachyamoeba lipophora]